MNSYSTHTLEKEPFWFSRQNIWILCKILSLLIFLHYFHREESENLVLRFNIPSWVLFNFWQTVLAEVTFQWLWRLGHDPRHTEYPILLGNMSCFYALCMVSSFFIVAHSIFPSCSLLSENVGEEGKRVVWEMHGDWLEEKGGNFWHVHILDIRERVGDFSIPFWYIGYGMSKLGFVLIPNSSLSFPIY